MCIMPDIGSEGYEQALEIQPACKAAALSNCTNISSRTLVFCYPVIPQPVKIIILLMLDMV